MRSDPLRDASSESLNALTRLVAVGNEIQSDIGDLYILFSNALNA